MTTRRRPVFRAAGVHLFVAVSTGAFLLAALVAPGGFWRDLVVTAATAVPTVAVGVVLARRMLPEPWPWISLTVGLAVMCVYGTVWMVEVHVWGLVPPATHATTLGMPIGYLFMLVGALMLLGRATRQNAGAMVDAALIALSVSLLVWVVVAPRLGPSGGGGRTMLILIVLGGLVGALLRGRSMLRQRRGSMTYMVLVISATLFGTVAREATATAESPGGAWWVGLVWIVAYCAVTGGAAHPSAAAHVTEAPHAGRLTMLRVVMLGASIAIGPTVLLVDVVVGTGVSTVPVAALNLAIVPLVVLRVAQLTRLHRDAEARLGHLVDHDPLTGLPNRRALTVALRRTVRRVRDGDSPGVVVLFCDLDGFKTVNDTLGHRVGDQLLVAVAGRLGSCVRTPADIVVRFAGDEFVVVVETAPDEADDVVRRVRAALSDDVVLGEHVLAVRASIGVATAGPGDPVTLDELLSAADARMYEHKRERRATGALDGRGSAAVADR